MADADRDSTEAAQHALAEVAGDWMSRPGVVAVEVARRWRAGAPTEEIAIRVTVMRKRPRGEVPEGELFPESLSGVPVDVVEGSPPQPER